jgi:hypothetical protein
MRPKRNAIISVLILLVVCVVAVLILMRSSSQTKSGHVVIDNLSDCSKNVTDGTVNDVETGVYKLVKSANDYNKLATAKSYKATIRKGTCQTTSKVVTDNSTQKKLTIQSSTIIVDIAVAKQSWKITYDWVTKDTGKVNVDLGTIQPSCLKVDQLLYGDFKCDSVLSLAQHGTDKVDPILQYMPYSGAGFTMEYDADTKTVSVAFQPPPDAHDIPLFIANTKAIIPYWFQKRGLDQSQYKIIYSDQIDSPDDNQD